MSTKAVCVRPEHEPVPEQQPAIGGGGTPTPGCGGGDGGGLERGLDGGSHELRGLPVDDDVPAEQYAADDPTGTLRRVVWADGVLGYSWDGRRNVLTQLPDTWICNAFYDDRRAARRPVRRTSRAIGYVTHSSKPADMGA